MVVDVLSSRIARHLKEPFKNCVKCICTLPSHHATLALPSSSLQKKEHTRNYLCNPVAIFRSSKGISGPVVRGNRFRPRFANSVAFRTAHQGQIRALGSLRFPLLPHLLPRCAPLCFTKGLHGEGRGFVRWSGIFWGCTRAGRSGSSSDWCSCCTCSGVGSCFCSCAQGTLFCFFCTFYCCIVLRMLLLLRRRRGLEGLIHRRYGRGRQERERAKMLGALRIHHAGRTKEVLATRTASGAATVARRGCSRRWVQEAPSMLVAVRVHPSGATFALRHLAAAVLSDIYTYREVIEIVQKKEKKHAQVKIQQACFVKDISACFQRHKLKIKTETRQICRIKRRTTKTPRKCARRIEILYLTWSQATRHTGHTVAKVCVKRLAQGKQRSGRLDQ